MVWNLIGMQLRQFKKKCNSNYVCMYQPVTLPLEDNQVIELGSSTKNHQKNHWSQVVFRSPENSHWMPWIYFKNHVLWQAIQGDNFWAPREDFKNQWILLVVLWKRFSALEPNLWVEPYIGDRWSTYVVHLYHTNVFNLLTLTLIINWGYETT